MTEEQYHYMLVSCVGNVVISTIFSIFRRMLTGTDVVVPQVQGDPHVLFSRAVVDLMTNFMAEIPLGNRRTIAVNTLMVIL